MIKLGVLAALDQRISIRYHMNGMTPTETGSYIRHHLDLAGRPGNSTGDLFSDDAITLIHDCSRGKPRTINTLATNALIAAAATSKKIVDESSARTAVSEHIAGD
jgi:type II secretory pathway predicted ATPase ExeA